MQMRLYKKRSKMDVMDAEIVCAIPKSELPWNIEHFVSCPMLQNED